MTHLRRYGPCPCRRKQHVQQGSSPRRASDSIFPERMHSFQDLEGSAKGGNKAVSTEEEGTVATQRKGGSQLLGPVF